MRGLTWLLVGAVALTLAVGPAEAKEKYPYKGSKILLFPYQVVEGSAAKQGLWEDEHEQPITRAKPVVLPKRGSKVKVLERLSVTYEEEGETLQVSRVEATSDAFTMLDGRPVSFKGLNGFVLSKRLR